jgi:hypothetical protein
MAAEVKRSHQDNVSGRWERKNVIRSVPSMDKVEEDEKKPEASQGPADAHRRESHEHAGHGPDAPDSRDTRGG